MRPGSSPTGPPWPSRVAIWSPNTHHWVLGALGALHAGAALVPVSTRFTGHEALDVIGRSGARALIVAGPFLGTDRLAGLRAAAAEDAQQGPAGSRLDRLSLTVRVPIEAGPVTGEASPPGEGAGGAGGVIGWAELPGLGAAVPAAVAAERAAAVGAGDVSDILFTSGTTGRSKGAMTAHRQSLAVARAWAECGRVSPADRYLVVNPFFHSFGFKAGILACLVSGAALVPQLVYDAGQAMALVEAERITVFPGPPTIYQTILDHPDRAAHDLSSLRLAVTGAATVPVALVERMRRELSFESVLTAYGLTEAVVVTMCRPGERRDLRDAVRGLLAQHGRGDSGDDRSLWRRLCGEIGAAGLAIPQRYGGAGAGPVETHIVMEELGRGLTCSPLLGSAVLTAQALLASGDAAACQRLLPAIADGSAVAALAWTTRAGRWDPGEAACAARPAARTTAAEAIQAIAEAAGPAVSSPDDWVLAGQAHHVLDGDAADVLLAAARTPAGVALFEMDPRGRGVTRDAVTTMDTTRRLAVVRLDRAPGRPVGAGGASPGSASPGSASPGSAALARARDLACVALSAEQVGAAQRALELTVAYTKVRVQFGRAIGSFQALQHRMADLHVLVESARSLSYAAADAAAGGAADLGLRAAAAKVYCSEALARVAAEMIQLHGAIGITWEHDAHRYLKRAHGAGQLFGRPSEHAARVAAALIDG